jgi:hypothetical protein
MTRGPHLDCAVNSARTMRHAKSGSDPLLRSTSQPELAKPLEPERRNLKSGRKLRSKPSFRYQDRWRMLTRRYQFSENDDEHWPVIPPAKTPVPACLGASVVGHYTQHK